MSPPLQNPRYLIYYSIRQREAAFLTMEKLEHGHVCRFCFAYDYTDYQNRLGKISVDVLFGLID